MSLTYAMIGGGIGASSVRSTARPSHSTTPQHSSPGPCLRHTRSPSQSNSACLRTGPTAHGRLVESGTKAHGPVDFVVIVTPNGTHFEAASCCGFERRHHRQAHDDLPTRPGSAPANEKELLCPDVHVLGLPHDP